MLDMIAFDADDTLWHNETLYARVQEQFKQLLLASLPRAASHDAEWVGQRLLAQPPAFPITLRGRTRRLSKKTQGQAITNWSTWAFCRPSLSR